MPTWESVGSNGRAEIKQNRIGRVRVQASYLLGLREARKELVKFIFILILVVEDHALAFLDDAEFGGELLLLN